MWDAIYFYDAIAQLSYHSAFMSNTVNVKLLYIRYATDFSLSFEQSTWFEHLMQNNAIYWNFELSTIYKSVLR